MALILHLPHRAAPRPRDGERDPRALLREHERQARAAWSLGQEWDCDCPSCS